MFNFNAVALATFLIGTWWALLAILGYRILQLLNLVTGKAQR